MKSLFPSISNWVESKQTFAIARVIKTWGSSPRPIGSALLINEKLELQGSVSGGCVEGAVAKASLPIITSGAGQILSFGIADEEAWAVGLSCGGKLDVFVERFFAFSKIEEEQAVWSKWKNCLKRNEGCILITSLTEKPTHSLILPDSTVFGYAVEEALKKKALACYQNRKHEVFEYKENAYFIQVFPRKSQLLIIGAAHITSHLVTLANMHDFESIVIDPRGFFTKGTKFESTPNQILEAYPEEVLSNFSLDAYTYAVVLSHDPKIDDNALQILLRSDVAYIGALGSRRTHAKRVKRLEEAGFSGESISRIHAPVGMDINAKSAQEIALSIMGEVIKIKNLYV